ncbi:MAG: hypothetical protein ACXVZL_08345 [Gaiellaceae bacterium]
MVVVDDETVAVVVGAVVEVTTTVVVCGLVEVVRGAVEVVRGAVVEVVELERCIVVGGGGAEVVTAAVVVRLRFTGFTFGSETTAPATPPVPAEGARRGCPRKLAAA